MCGSLALDQDPQSGTLSAPAPTSQHPLQFLHRFFVTGSSSQRTSQECVSLRLGASLGPVPYLCVTLRVSLHQPCPQSTPSPGWAEPLSEAGYMDTWAPGSKPDVSVTLRVPFCPAACPLVLSLSLSRLCRPLFPEGP